MNHPETRLLNVATPLVAVLLLTSLTACGFHETMHRSPPADFGLLLMAHGGQKDWNRGILDLVDGLDGDYPVEVAFGMADAERLEQAVQRLETRGVGKIAVVRLFISGESFYTRTRQILGLQAGAPTHPATDAASDDAAGMAFWRIHTRAEFALSRDGLADAPGMGAVLADRAIALSQHPQREDVLILAHGPGDDAGNQRWLARMEARANTVRQALPFRRVQVMTLREDWPQKRAAATARTREFVARSTREHGNAIVIPFRVHGFGPYTSVLEDLDYVADGRALLPSVQVADWVREQVAALRAGHFERQASG